ncbi:MAG: hypothetical protein JXA11_11530 [Phycisphaerae bacterium]|nr:hypothetical protein [Phycisphaerae bacterium]
MFTHNNSAIQFAVIFTAAILNIGAFARADEALKSAGAKARDAGNLLANPGFEEKGKSWTWAFWSGEGTKGTGQWTADCHSGKQAVKIIGLDQSETNEEPRGLFYSPPVQCSPGIYEISGFYKTTGKIDSYVQIQTYDTDDPKDLIRKKANKKIYRCNVQSSPNWKYFKRQFSFGEECKQLIVMLRGNGVGSVTFDDLKLRELNEPIHAFLFPGRWAHVEDKAYIIEKNVAPIMFGLTGDAEKLTYPLSFEVEAPAAVKLHSVWPLREIKTVAGSRKYVIELTAQDIQKLGMKKTLTHDAWITLWAEVNAPLAETRLHWRLYSDQAKYPRKTAKLFVLPALPENQYARNFDIMFVWGLLDQAPKELWERVYHLYRSCGINCYLIHSKPAAGTWIEYCYKRFKEDGGKVILNASPGWRHSNNTFPGIYGENWLFRIANEGPAAFEKLDQGFSASMTEEVDGFLWDAEFKPWAGISYKEQTLAGFADYMKLDKERVTEELVKDKYSREYYSYCVDYLGGKIMKGWAAYLKKIKPDALLLAVQGEGADGGQMDLAYYDVEGITHSPMVYPSNARSWADTVERTSDYALQPLMPTSTTWMIRNSGTVAQRSPESIRMGILTTASLGESGICFWPDLQRSMGAKYMWQMARASANIRTVEEFIAKGNRIDQKVTVEGLPETESEIIIEGKRHLIRYPEWRNYLNYQAYQIHKDRLITVFNLNEEKAAFVRITAKINWPEDGFKVHDTISGTRFVPSPESDTWSAEQLAEGVVVQIDPSEAVFLKITWGETNLPGKKVCVQDTVNAYEQLRAQSRGKDQSSEIRKGGLKIAWDDGDHDGSLDVLMASPAQKVWITRSGGRLPRWEPAGTEKNIIRPGKDTGDACMDLFWAPENARWQTSPQADYRVVDRGIKDGRAFVTLERKVPKTQVAGLVISKTYSIDEKTADVAVAVKITNRSLEAVIKFSYWSHNCFALGDSDKLVYETGNGVFVQEKAGKSGFAHRADLPKEMAAFASKADFEPMTGDWLATWNERTKEAITVTLDKASLLQIYKWAREGKYSMEWMYQPVDLELNKSWDTKFILRYRKNQQMIP